MKIIIIALSVISVVLLGTTIGFGVAYNQKGSSSSSNSAPVIPQEKPYCKIHQPYLDRMVTFKTLYSGYIKNQEDGLFDFYKTMGSSIEMFNSSKTEMNRRVNIATDIYNFGNSAAFDCTLSYGDDGSYSFDLGMHTVKYKTPLAITWEEMNVPYRSRFDGEGRFCPYEHGTGSIITEWVHLMEAGDSILYSKLEGSNQTAFNEAKLVFSHQQDLLKNAIADKKLRDSLCNSFKFEWDSNTTDVHHRTLMYAEIEKMEFKKIS